MSTCHIGNLNFDTSGPELEQFIAGFGFATGPISVNLKYNSEGTSRGWGLVTFASDAEANTCIEMINGAVLDERPLRVKLDGAPNPAREYHAPATSTFEPSASSTRIYVGNLPWSVDDAALYEMFQAHTPVSANIVMGRDGRSRGYGLVEFTTREVAEAAIIATNGMDAGGRNVTVRWDDKGANTRAGRKVAPNSSIFVRNLPEDMNWKGLKDLFFELKPEFADIKTNPEGYSRGWGIVRFADSNTANDAILAFNGYCLSTPSGDYTLEVRLDNKPSH